MILFRVFIISKTPTSFTSGVIQKNTSTVLADASPERSLVAGFQEEQEISNLSQPASDSSTTLDVQILGCPGLDTHRGNDELCQKGEIMCLPTMWPLQDLYCHKVGLDTAAEEATPAPSEHVTATRMLEEEKETSNPPQTALESSTTLDAQHGGCTGWDTRQPNLDDECPEGQFMCLSITGPFTAVKNYCEWRKDSAMTAKFESKYKTNHEKWKIKK